MNLVIDCFVESKCVDYIAALVSHSKSCIIAPFFHPMEAHGARSRYTPRSIRDPVVDRCRRYGRSVQSVGHAAEPSGRDQSAALALGRKLRDEAALRARST